MIRNSQNVLQQKLSRLSQANQEGDFKLFEQNVRAEFMWPIPTLTVELKGVEKLNRRLAQIILEKEREVTSKGKPTMVAGLSEGLTAHWLEYNVLSWDHPEIAEFRQHVLAGLREFFKLIGDPDSPEMKVSGISRWANVLHPGQALEVHHHYPAFVSMHYHVQSGNEPDDPELSPEAEQQNSGSTVYFRPGFMERSHGGKAAGLASPWDENWRISTSPTEGKLFFFPSYIRHEVRPYMGKSQRISIALDVFLKKQNAPIYFATPRWFVPQ